MKPEEVRIQIPKSVNRQLYEAGFEHGMKSNNLSIFKASYSAGFRAAKLYLKELREQQGVVHFPFKGKINFKVDDK